MYECTKLANFFQDMCGFYNSTWEKVIDTNKDFTEF